MLPSLAFTRCSRRGQRRREACQSSAVGIRSCTRWARLFTIAYSPLCARQAWTV